MLQELLRSNGSHPLDGLPIGQSLLVSASWASNWRKSTSPCVAGDLIAVKIENDFGLKPKCELIMTLCSHRPPSAVKGWCGDQPRKLHSSTVSMAFLFA